MKRIPFPRLRYDALALWLIMHFALIGSFLTYHTSPDPTISDRYSPVFMALVIGIGAWAILSAVLFSVLALLPPERFRRLLGGFGRLREHLLFRVIVIVPLTMFMTSYWLRFPDILRDIPHPYIRFCGSITIMAVVYFGLFWRAESETRPLRWRWWLLGGSIGLAVALTVGISYIGHFPQMDTLDEIHNYIVQWTFARTGILGESIFREMIPIPQPLYDSPHMVVGLLMRLFGDTFWQARLIRLMLSLIALPFIYNIGKILYGRRAGFFAVVAGLAYLLPSAYSRPDFAVGVLLSIGIYAYLKAEQVDHPLLKLPGKWAARLRLHEKFKFSPFLHFLAGLFVGMSVEGHLLSYRFGIAFALIYLVTWVWRMGKRKRLFLDGRIIALAFGASIALMIYVSVHILPGWDQAIHFLGGYAPSTTASDQGSAADLILRRQVDIWQQTTPIEMWMLLVAVLMAGLRFGRGDRILLTLLLVSEGLMLTTYSYYRVFYQAHYLPLVALLIGKMLADGFDFASGPRPKAAKASQLVLAAMVMCVSLSVLIDNAAQSGDPMRTEFEAIGIQLAATIPEDKVVVANEDYFLHMPRMTFYSISTVATPTWFLTTVQGLPLFEQLQPDIFVISPQIDIPRYVPMTSINIYLARHNFRNVRCYTSSGLITAQVWVRELPPGWSWDDDKTCQPWS
jgi:hypothetical protein